MGLLIQILLYTVRFSGFFIYLYGAYQFIEVEFIKSYKKDKQLEINKRRTKYFWIMILGIFLIFVTGIFQQ